MGKNELSEAGNSMVRDNMANFRRDTRKTRVTGYPGGKACLGHSTLQICFREGTEGGAKNQQIIVDLVNFKLL